MSTVESGVPRPARPVRIVADRDADGHFAFSWKGYWTAAQADHAEVRGTGVWDPATGVMFRIQDRTIALHEMRRAFLESLVARELSREGAPDYRNPNGYPVFAPSGDAMTRVPQPRAHALVAHGMAVWVQEAVPARGLFILPAEARLRVPGTAFLKWTATRPSAPADVFTYWVRRLPPGIAEFVVVKAVLARPLAIAADVPGASHLFSAAAALLQSVRPRFDGGIDAGTMSRWGGIAREWIGAVRSGHDPARALGILIGERRPTSPPGSA